MRNFYPQIRIFKKSWISTYWYWTLFVFENSKTETNAIFISVNRKNISRNRDKKDALGGAGAVLLLGEIIFHFKINVPITLHFQWESPWVAYPGFLFSPPGCLSDLKETFTPQRLFLPSTSPSFWWWSLTWSWIEAPLLTCSDLTIG